MYLVSAKDPLQRIGNHVLKMLAEIHYQAVRDPVSVYIEHLRLSHDRYGRFLEMDFLPRKLICDTRSPYGKRGIDHRRVTGNVELGKAHRIRDQGIYQLELFIQETNGELCLENQFFFTVDLAFTLHIPTGSLSKEQGHLQRNRIRINRIGPQRIIYATVST